jgi:hypothetical protein
MMLSAGYPGPHVAIWRCLGASLNWSVFAACFTAFLTGESEVHWSLTPRLCVETRAERLSNRVGEVAFHL